MLTSDLLRELLGANKDDELIDHLIAEILGPQLTSSVAMLAQNFRPTNEQSHAMHKQIAEILNDYTDIEKHPFDRSVMEDPIKAELADDPAKFEATMRVFTIIARAMDVAFSAATSAGSLCVGTMPPPSRRAVVDVLQKAIILGLHTGADRGVRIYDDYMKERKAQQEKEASETPIHMPDETGAAYS